MGQSWSQSEGTNSKSLYERGLDLYEDSEQKEFQNAESMERGLCFIVQAAQAGEREAIRWIGTFYKTKSSLPTGLVLPSELEDKIRGIARQSEREEQVATAMPDPWSSERAGSKSMPSRFQPVLEQEDQDVMMAPPGPKSMPSKFFSDSEEQVATTAKTMFSKMAKSSPTQTIPKGEIHERVQEFLSESEELEGEHEWESSFEGYAPSRKELQQSMASIMFCTLRQNPSDEITEEAFCKTAVTLAKGEEVAEQEVLSPQELEDYDKASILTKVYKYPRQAFLFLKRSSFKAAEKYSTKWLWSTIHLPIQQFLLAYFLPMLTASLLVIGIAFIVFAVVFFVMMMATLEIFDKMEKISSSKKISSIFQYFDPSARKIKAKAPEQQVQYSIGYYATFIIVFPSAILALKMAQQQPVFMYIGMCLIIPAAVIVVAIIVEFWHYGAFFLMSGIIHVLHMLSLIESPWGTISELLFAKQKVAIASISLFTLAQLAAQLVLMTDIILKKRSYLELVPCALFVSWLALCRNFLFHTDLDCFPVLLWIFSALLIAFSKPDFTHLKTTLQSIPWWSALIILLFVGIPVIEQSGNWYLSAYPSCSSSAITMPEYAERCGPQNHDKGNMVQTQLNCQNLEGCPFEARGTVKFIKIDHSHKKQLPFIQAILLRLFGHANLTCGDRGQHMEIQLQMSLNGSDQPISVSLTSANCKVLKIEAGVELHFNSTFQHGMGSDKLTLKLSNWSIEGDSKTEEREDEEDKQHVPTHALTSVENTLLLSLEVLFCCIILINL